MIFNCLDYKFYKIFKQKKSEYSIFPSSALTNATLWYYFNMVYRRILEFLQVWF